MKEGYVEKSGETTEQDMELINRYTRRELTTEEVYTFSVVLCDNEIDRDYERFTTEALEKLAVLFVGRTGIFDHQNSSANQAARIYSCRVERPEGKTTSFGEPYARLTAKAYLPRGGVQEDLILQLDAGIKKEVSVGCSVGSVRCSVCGEEVRRGTCRHQKGKVYGGRVCHHILEEPSDAYEWSFVAVPAQREAGVIKHYLPESGKACTLTESQVCKLRGHLEDLEKRAGMGDEYRDNLRREVVRLSGILQPGIALPVMERVVQRMTLDELKAFHKAYSQKMEETFPVSPQLAGRDRSRRAEGDRSFQI